MIVDDDAAIDRDTGVSGDFGVRLDADRNNDRVGRKHAAVLELYTLDVTIADESRRRDVQQHPDAFRLDRTLEQQRGACVELALHQAIHEMNQCHRCAGFGETVSRLNAQEPAADHDNGRTPAGSPRHRRDVAHVAECEHAGQIGAGDAQADRPRAGGEYELGERQRFAVGQRHGACGNIRRRHADAVAQGDAPIAPPGRRLQ